MNSSGPLPTRSLLTDHDEFSLAYCTLKLEGDLYLEFKDFNTAL